MRPSPNTPPKMKMCWGVLVLGQKKCANETCSLRHFYFCCTKFGVAQQEDEEEDQLGVGVGVVEEDRAGGEGDAGDGRAGESGER